ncbi:MAG TPA: class I SAM-dependent methyltransferase [Verrucomicrobiae bacterium]|jgi:SAM-dependent methyltransferase|nr:class I SAM-dependent methyltransferase [Verrucomicrobiae bacterium]
MDVEKFYEQYWTSGQHIAKEWNEKQFHKWLKPLIGLERVLDYGCGMGYSYQRRLVEAVKQYTGADVGATALATTQKKGLSALKIDPNEGTINATSDSFDGVVCSEVFEHLFEPLNAARELHRVLKPGGVLVLTVPNFGYHAWRLLALLRAQVPSEPEDKVGNRYHGVHIRFFSKLMLKRLLRDAGFVDIKVGSFGEASVWDVFNAAGHFGLIAKFAREKLPAPFHLRFLQDIWPNVFAERLHVVAYKPK